MKVKCIAGATLAVMSFFSHCAHGQEKEATAANLVTIGTPIEKINIWLGSPRFRSTIIALSAASRVPAVYPERDYTDDGGLIAYGANAPDSFRRAAQYVDRILRGANPGDLPINEASKFDFVVNLKTAKALGLTIPPSLLARADEVIE